MRNITKLFCIVVFGVTLSIGIATARTSTKQPVNPVLPNLKVVPCDELHGGVTKACCKIFDNSYHSCGINGVTCVPSGDCMVY